VKAVHQFPENPVTDRFTIAAELNQVLTVCDIEGDLELKAFIKNGDPIKLLWSQIIIDAISNLPSFGSEDVFPGQAKRTLQGEFFETFYGDISKRFRRVCKRAKLHNLRIHDLRYYATAVLHGHS
jgi:integrase